MSLYYNPLDRACKSIQGAVRYGELFKLRIYLSDEDCRLYIRSDGGVQTYEFVGNREQDGFSFDVQGLPVGLFWYSFRGKNSGLIGRDDTLTGVFANGESLREFQLSVYDVDYTVPTWLKGGIIYQIFPDRFCKVGDFSVPDYKVKRDDWGGIPYYKPVNGKVLNNDFFGGNIKGVISKLPYLQSLGVTCIYFNPIFKAYSNHRYDTGDYEKIDEVFGTEKEFSELIKKAKEKNIKIILDGVFNHTGDDSKYFNKYGRYTTTGAYNSPDSKYYKWYTFDKYPDVYRSWWGVDVLPTVNKESIEFEDYIAGDGGIIEKYMKLGVSGFRLDVVDEIPDRFVKKLRTAIKKNSHDGVIIGEVWEDATNKISYDVRREYFLGKELDSVMNYELKNAIIDFVVNSNSDSFIRVVKEQLNNYPHDSLNLLMNFLGTHDTPRILTVLGRTHIPTTKEEMEYEVLSDVERDTAIKRLKLAVVALYTVYGVPSVYYGDETGLQGGNDPFNRRCMTWDNVYEEISSLYKRLGKIRTEIGLFKQADFNILHVEYDMVVYERNDGVDNVVVVINAGDNTYSLELSERVYDLISNEKYENEMEVQAKTAYILYKEKI